jgi:hypothetical protein
MRSYLIRLLSCIKAEKHLIYRNQKIRHVNVYQSTDDCHSIKDYGYIYFEYGVSKMSSEDFVQFLAQKADRFLIELAA